MKAGGTAVRVEASPDGLGLLCHPFMPFDPARDFPSQDRDQQPAILRVVPIQTSECSVDKRRYADRVLRTQCHGVNQSGRPVYPVLLPATRLHLKHLLILTESPSLNKS